ncbi:hypothetical protein PBY51_011836 [Eleginops maclovinus]|uniref:Uncharacterized protein n=1 Tax=Eleginops maclovinus TaxID=56733 RepID=A0AAN7XVD5_ELEMC|nr:hypothetical protein PBY51_011836 [Eleginops maclovinus]
MLKLNNRTRQLFQPTHAQDRQHGSDRESRLRRSRKHFVHLLTTAIIHTNLRFGQALHTPRNINCRVLKNVRIMLKLNNRTRQLFQPAQDHQHGSETSLVNIN